MSTEELRAELDAYRAETRAARAEAAAFRAEINAYHAEVAAWQSTTEDRFARIEGYILDILQRLSDDNS